MEIRFFVPGMPVPQGSKSAMQHKNTGKVVMFDQSSKRLKPWRKSIKTLAQAAMGGDAWDGPVAVCLDFTFPRPKNHYGSGKNINVLKQSAPAWKTTKPDIDKLARAVLDGLTGALFIDDKQVAKLTATKLFAERPERYGVHIWAVQVDV